ncbi:sugar ABC transporter substrate-binding protein [Terrisporobacter sp.]|uniref:sugar ABC transporter substrate-binding protein n=1 Tax=Terrisporobacter sp. TaxID=1965305 RepID=UPI001A8D0F3D|nr:sugar ABC transporter substrate-binding protein [Terrisporobacter sp.]MBN9646936.1 sugar ABC transporter substrate-binding protein [Terrisporobacter glycolicus]
MKKIAAIIMSMMMVIGLVGCSTSEKKKDSKLKVGYVTMDMTSPYFIEMIDGMKEEANKLGIELSVHDGKYEAQPQIDAMETLITQKVDVIVLSANDTEALQPMIDKAKEAGIKVIAANVEMKNVDAFVSLDEYEYGFMGGEIAGKYIADKMKGKGEVAVLTFSQIPAVLNRSKGLIEGIKKHAPNVKVVSKVDANDRESGMKAAENILQAHPNVNVVVGISDDAVLGAYEAFKGANKTGDDVCLVGLDAVNEAIAKIDEGTIYRGSVDIAPFQSGKDIIETAKKVVEDGPIKEMIKFPMTPVTKENVAEFK